MRAQAPDRGFLWRLQKGGRSSYLYGTLHLGRRDWLVPGPQTRAALQAADVVAVELDTQDPAILEGIHKGFAPSPGRAWPERLRQRLKAQLKQGCLSESMVASLSPEMLATTLVVMSGRHDGLHAAYGIDPVLAALGRQLRKRVISLETPELQARALRELIGGSTQSLDAMLQSLENGEARRILLRTAAAWSQSQSQEFEGYGQWCECMRTPQERELMKRMLDDRNPHLAQGIAREHEQGRSVFAAVGSLHLFGPRSLPKLLAEQGFELSAVPLNAPQAAALAP